MEERKEGIFFTVDETLCLDYGQEIDEMLGISLDPDITLQMYEQYVQIRGIVMLKGEYRKYRAPHGEPRVEREDAVYVEKVLDKNANEARFSHRFPLDISIPNERVESLNDIEITIDAFDYELPDVRTLTIEANLHIHGVKDRGIEQEEAEEKEMEKANLEEEKASDILDSTESENDTPSETVEPKKMYEENKSPENSEIPEAPEKPEPPHNHPNQSNEKMKSNVTNEEPKSTKDYEENDSSKQEEPLKSEAHKAHREEQKSNQASETIEDIDFEEVSPSAEEDEKEVEHKKESRQLLEQTSVNLDGAANDIDIQLSESESVEEEETFEDVQFLTDLFGGDEEEKKTTIRLYIIQEEDTIESIAKKYEIPTLELLKDNQLSGENIQEGQLIKIPISK